MNAYIEHHRVYNWKYNSTFDQGDTITFVELDSGEDLRVAYWGGDKATVYTDDGGDVYFFKNLTSADKYALDDILREQNVEAQNIRDALQFADRMSQDIWDEAREDTTEAGNISQSPERESGATDITGTNIELFA